MFPVLLNKLYLYKVNLYYTFQTLLILDKAEF